MSNSKLSKYTGCEYVGYLVLRLRRLLFTHYMACNLCRLVEIRLHRWGLVLTSKCASAKLFAVASFRNSSAQFYKPAWCSNFSTLSDSRCKPKGLLLIAWSSFARVCNFTVFHR